MHKKKRINQSKFSRQQAKFDGNNPEHAAFGDETMPNFAIVDTAVRMATQHGITRMYYMPVNQHLHLWNEEVYNFICLHPDPDKNHVLKMICHAEGMNVRGARIKHDGQVQYIDGDSGLRVSWDPNLLLNVAVSLPGCGKTVLIPVFKVGLSTEGGVSIFNDLGEDMMSFAKFDRVRIPDVKIKVRSVRTEFLEEKDTPIVDIEF